MRATNYLNERNVVLSCQRHILRVIYSPPDDELDTASELGSDPPAYCLQVPMEVLDRGNGRSRTSKAKEDEHRRLLKDGVPDPRLE
ncbi:hypothetical protein TNCV_2577521 [Trichonephila clavipes]|nr:hypothetical protein TNCV_2577521 [Trichonephila clavipes]